MPGVPGDPASLKARGGQSRHFPAALCIIVNDCYHSMHYVSHESCTEGDHNRQDRQKGAASWMHATALVQIEVNSRGGSLAELGKLA